MVRALNKARRNNTLYVKLLGSDAGRRRQRRAASSLPPSVLAVLEADRNGGNFNPLHSATLGEWEIPTDHAVSGVADADHHRVAELTRGRLPFGRTYGYIHVCTAMALPPSLCSLRGDRSRASSPKFFAGGHARPISSKAMSRICRSTARAS